ncbi:unnamed protein product [Polarella glacialis]|uniref:Uncharacterized protein n=1 Tax=Polarella glacialis TaxID=89957 RepID=A0A813GKF1_POLGL|nr:unnamed protein product [Polarella glacialis]CAE8674242.1 unnamed protein product [Polarella glacialis]
MAPNYDQEMANYTERLRLAQAHKENSDSEESEDETPCCLHLRSVKIDLPWFICAVVFLLVLLIVPIVVEVVAWTKQGSCDAKEGQVAAPWGTVVPAATMTQMQSSWTNMAWYQVDVYDQAVSNTTTLGYWSDVDLLFGMISKYVYVDSITGRTVLEAWKPGVFFMGKRFHLARCAGAGAEYFIEEDWWTRQWFNWDASIKFNIKNSAGEIIATSQRKRSNVWSIFSRNDWQGTIESPNGDLIAALKQEPFTSGDLFFTWQKWHTKNLRPDLLPNEVVSFLSAVYDIAQKQQTEKNSDW